MCRSDTLKWRTNNFNYFTYTLPYEVSYDLIIMRHRNYEWIDIFPLFEVIKPFTCFINRTIGTLLNFCPINVMGYKFEFIIH